MKRLFIALVCFLFVCSAKADLYLPPGGSGGGGSITLPQTIGGVVNSGGIACFTSTTTMASSPTLTASGLVIGGGTGVCPSTTTTAAGVLTALGIAPGTTGSFVLQDGAITTGHCLQWAGALGVVDAGAACGSSGVSSLSYNCPVAGPLTGAVTLPNGIGEVAENSNFAPTAAQCGVAFDSTGGANATLPTIGGGGGQVQNPYFLTIKNADTSASMTISGGGTNINYNGVSAASITLNAGQSVGFWINSANTLWQASGTVSGTVPIWHPGYISGNWYNTNTSPAISTGAPQTASSVYCALQRINIPMTIKAMGSYFTTGVTSGNVSYAIYSASAGRPATLLDFAGPVAEPTAAGAATATLNTTPYTLSPGDYFYCETQDNATGVMNSVYASNISSGAPWVGTPTPNSVAFEVVAGISCTAASTCGTGFAAWSGGAFTWANFSNPTWSTTTETTKIPYIKVQVN